MGDTKHASVAKNFGENLSRGQHSTDLWDAWGTRTMILSLISRSEIIDFTLILIMGAEVNLALQT